MSLIAIILTVVMVLSGIGLIVFVMMHSGKGSGLSDSIVPSLSSENDGISAMESNLDKITVVCAVLFILSLIGMMMFFPLGTIG